MTTENTSQTRCLKTNRLTADFVVVGGGMAGTIAAIAAARNGARVILVQDRSVLGGNASSEIRMHIVGADSHGGKPGCRETGILEELRLEDAVRNPHRSYSQWDLLLYEKVKAESKITLLLDTTCVSAEVGVNEQSERRITAIRALRNWTDDEFLIEAKWFADCSGDGRLGA
jgi:glycine/D-amino acid oxidase-like deaminating enzyme